MSCIEGINYIAIHKGRCINRLHGVNCSNYSHIIDINAINERVSSAPVPVPY